MAYWRNPELQVILLIRQIILWFPLGWPSPSWAMQDSTFIAERVTEREKTEGDVQINICWQGRNRLSSQIGVCFLSLCTKAENREWVVDCLINICHLRRCINTIHPARTEIAKWKTLKILFYWVFCLFYALHDFSTQPSLKGMFHWFYPSTVIFIVPVKGFLAVRVGRRISWGANILSSMYTGGFSPRRHGAKVLTYYQRT